MGVKREHVVLLKKPLLTVPFYKASAEAAYEDVGMVQWRNKLIKISNNITVGLTQAQLPPR